MSRPITDIERRRLSILDDLPAGLLRVTEIYASIQGESTFAGLPCSFIRLTGCGLRCRWCDTAYSFAGGTTMSRDEVIAAVLALPPKLVELTGGEPLSQPAAIPLMRELADAGFQVLIETAGHLSIEPIDPRVTIILDLKCPGSGESSANDLDNLPMLKSTDEIKFVIADRVDFDWAVAMVQQHQLLPRAIHFSPVFGELPYQTLCEWILQSKLPIRFQMQQHSTFGNRPREACD